MEEKEKNAKAAKKEQHNKERHQRRARMSVPQRRIGRHCYWVVVTSLDELPLSQHSCFTASHGSSSSLLHLLHLPQCLTFHFTSVASLFASSSCSTSTYVKFFLTLPFYLVFPVWLSPQSHLFYLPLASASFHLPSSPLAVTLPLLLFPLLCASLSLLTSNILSPSFKS